MNAHMYSLLPLPRNLCLRENPYSSSKGAERLKDYGILFYRDEDHPEGVFGVEKPSGLVKAYYTQLILNEEDFSVDEFDGDFAEARIKKHGDAKAFLVLNQQVVIVDMGPTFVTVQS